MEWPLIVVFLISYIFFLGSYLGNKSEQEQAMYNLNTRFTSFENKLDDIKSELDTLNSDMSEIDDLIDKVGEIDSNQRERDEHISEISKRLNELNIVQDTLFEDYIKRNPKDGV